jgi:hypothetical protein
MHARTHRLAAVIASPLIALALLLAMPLEACKDQQPPAPVPTPSAIPKASTSANASVQPLGTVDADASIDAAISDAGTTASASGGSDDASIALYAGDGAPLGQTDAFPSLTSVTYQDRIMMLWDAIVKDEPELAKPAFFPLVAYEQVKAIPKPAIDYERRLLKAFARDIHAYHQKLGKDPSLAKLVRLDVPEAKAKWMDPGSEGNKLGYDRVLDSKLVFTRDGKESTLDVKSMISWRGEWYVVHLAGFK